MRKLNLLATGAVLVILIVTGYYFIVVRNETVVISPTPNVSQPPPSSHPEKSRIDHGDFRKRFEPKPPPPDGNR